jgi:hypothetical protein
VPPPPDVHPADRPPPRGLSEGSPLSRWSWQCEAVVPSAFADHWGIVA